MKRKLLIRIVLLLSALWLVLLSVFYFHSKNFQEHILNIFKPYLDERLATEIHIQKDDIHFTLIKNFPNLSISLNNLFIKSTADPDLSEVSFNSIDTLLFAKEIHFVFNMKSLFQKEYELKRIELEDAKLNLFKDKAGQVNYKIFRSLPKDSIPKSFSLNLRKISLKNVSLNYFNTKSKSHFYCTINEGEFSGNFNDKDFQFTAKTNLSDCKLYIKSEKIFTHQSLSLELNLAKKENIYSIQEGKIEYSGIKMSASGKFDSQKKYYSFSLSSHSAPLSRLDIPVINSYLNKYHARLENGLIDIATSITGYIGNSPPSVKLNYKIDRGILKYKDYKLKVTDVYSKGQFTNGSQHNSASSEFSIDTLIAKSGKSNVSLSGSIKNFSSPSISASIKTDLELEKLVAFVRMPENYDIAGFVTGNVQLKFILPANKSFKSIDWSKGYFTGKLTIHEAYLEQVNRNMPISLIKGELKILTVSELAIKDIIVNTGSSDLLINGSVKNISLFTGKKSLFPVYQCEILSNEFHTDDFLILHTENKKTMPVKVNFPDSVLVNAKFSAKNFTSGKFKATQVDGFLMYQPKTLTIQNFSMKSLGGSIASNLSIKEQNNIIIAHCDAKLTHVDIGDLFYTFNNFKQDVIQSENLDGALSGTTQFVTAWDQYLNLLPEKISLSSQIRIDDGELINYKPLLGLSDYIKVEELKHIKFNTLWTTVEIKDKKVLISQTNIQSSAISLKGSGEHGFDKNYAYRLQIQLSDVLWKKAKRKKPENTEFGYVVDDEKEITMIPIIITGNETKYEINYDKTTAKSSFKNKVQKEKQVLREMFSPDSKDKNPPIVNKDSLRIEWEEDEKPGSSKKNKIETDEKEEEFLIEWKDE